MPERGGRTVHISRLCYTEIVIKLGVAVDKQTYKQAVKTYKNRARKKYADLKADYKGKSLAERWKLYKQTRYDLKDWKQDIHEIEDKHERKAQKKRLQIIP